MERAESPVIPSDALHWAALNARWEKRARIAVEWLKGARIVADIGCGMMTLERLLPKSVQYIPLDVVPRDDRTIVIDLNTDLIPALICDAAVLLGVLEYTDNVAGVLEQLRQFPKCIVSYNHVFINDLLWVLRLRARRVTWRNRYTKSGFRRLLKSSGLQIMRQRMVRPGERLYEVRSASG